jgi:hypothetical protein
MAEPDAGSAAVLRDELDTGCFKGLSKSVRICLGHGDSTVLSFGTTDGSNTKLAMGSKILSTPAKNSTRGADLDSSDI